MCIDGVTVLRRLFTRGEWVSGGARFFSLDHLNSVTEVTDASNTLLARYDYDPWGRQTLASGTDVTKTGYTGHPRHTTGDLWLTKFRAYDPRLGRWLSQDPQGMSDGPNMYSYVSNKPTTHLDPDGLAGIGFPPGAEYAMELAARPLTGSTSTITIGRTSRTIVMRTAWPRA